MNEYENPRIVLRGVLVRRSELIDVPERKTQMVRATVRAGDEWILLAYGEQARALADLRPGAVVRAEAALTNHTWHTADGTTHQSITITVEQIEQWPTNAVN